MGIIGKKSWNIITEDWENEWVILALFTQDFFVQTLFVSNDQITSQFLDEMIKWNFSISSGWGYHASQEECDASITPPLNINNPLWQNVEPVISGGCWISF